MTVEVLGSRKTQEDWSAAEQIPKEELPPLTDAQKATAKQLHIPEEFYARDKVASHLAGQRLLLKVDRVARYLSEILKNLDASVTLEKISLDTFGGRYDIELGANGHRLPVRMDEKLIDELFEGGSEEAERRISRVLELAVRYQPQ